MPRGNPTTYPIVLASGFGTSPTLNSFRGVPAALRADGHVVYVADLPPFDATEVRAAALAKTVDAALAETGADKVNIIGHSSGGTDARDLVSRLGYGDRVASVTTVSSAHHGSPLADLALDALGGVSDEALDAFAAFLGSKFSDLANDSHLRAGIASIAERNADAFNESHPDDPRVHYQSWAGVAAPAGVVTTRDDTACEHKRFANARVDGVVHVALSPMWLAMSDRSNDALVPVESAKHGVFRGCIPGDHMAEIGGSASAPAVDPHSGFDHVRFYRLMAFDLAAMGY